MIARKLVTGAVCASLAALAPDVTAIVNGSASSQWPGVGAVQYEIAPATFAICTGFAVSIDWVLTAAHCIAGATPDKVSFISEPEGAILQTYVADILVPHPSYNPPTVTDFDVALVHVTQAMPVVPFKVNSQALSAAAVGRTIDLLGYGFSSPNDFQSAAKRFGQTTISAITAQSITNGYSPSGTCSVDDGAPVFVYDTDGFPLALGVATFADANCNTSDSSQRIDTVLLFLETHANICTDGTSCDGVFRNTFESNP